jgi:hypothetical protein
MKDKQNDLLIYGKEYRLYRNGEFIGTAVYTNDPNIGDSFLNEKSNGTFEVYIADEWYFNN